MQHQKTMSKKRCLVCVTDGSEDIEIVTIVDTLRRAKDIEVVIGKVSHTTKKELVCELMQGIKIVRRNFHEYRLQTSSLTMSLMDNSI